jgi:hypothetical protein
VFCREEDVVCGPEIAFMRSWAILEVGEGSQIDHVIAVGNDG